MARLGLEEEEEEGGGGGGTEFTGDGFFFFAFFAWIFCCCCLVECEDESSLFFLLFPLPMLVLGCDLSGLGCVYFLVLFYTFFVLCVCVMISTPFELLRLFVNLSQFEQITNSCNTLGQQE